MNCSPQCARPARFDLLAIALLLLIQAAFVAKLVGYAALESRRSDITVVAPPLERVFGEISPYGPGFERELVELFARHSGFPVRWIMAANWEEAWEIFATGRADMLIAPGYAPPSDARPARMSFGPVYFSHPALMLHNRRRHGLRDPSEICSSEVAVTDNPALASALFEEASLVGCGDPQPRREQDSLTDVLDELSANRMRFSMAEGGRFQVLEPFYPNLRKAGAVGQTIEHRWIWDAGDDRISESVERFWADILDDPAFLDLKDRYFGYFPAQTDYFELLHFFSALRTKLPRYVPSLIKAAKSESIDPLLLVAMIYKESAFDPEATSPTGARGLLQMIRSTAEELQVDPLDPEASILAGARYLRKLGKRLEALPLGPWDKWFLALSAYNQGLAHTLDAVDLAGRLGRDGHRWSELKTVYPLLSYSKYHSQTSSGYARGYEAVDYVESIRYYYYILHGLIILGRPEGNQLAPLFEAIPREWP
jgi:membrane-bound lytic murein transglycosylase F